VVHCGERPTGQNLTRTVLEKGGAVSAAYVTLGGKKVDLRNDGDRIVQKKERQVREIYSEKKQLEKGSCIKMPIVLHNKGRRVGGQKMLENTGRWVCDRVGNQANKGD